MKIDYSLFSPETQVLIARAREAVNEGADPHDPATKAKLIAAITAMRGDRTAAIQAAAASAKKSRTPRASKEERVAAIDTSKAMEGF